MTNAVLIGDLEHIHTGLASQHARFRDASVLLTGCAGFLGFYFLQYLVRYAEELRLKKIIGLDTFVLEQPLWLNDLKVDYPDTLELYKFNIATDDVTSLEDAANVELVIHMASIASPVFYRRHPVETLDANVWGLRRLLEAYKHSRSIRGCLFFSSSEVYGDPDPTRLPTDEEYRGNVASVGPRACYDEAKRFGETLCYVFAKTYAMPITIVRPFNNYGPGMRLTDGRLPADFASAVLEGRDIVIRSDGSPTRTFCYVSDAIIGYLLCLLHGEFDYFNIGIEKPEISVRELADIYRTAGKELFGYRGDIRYEKSSDTEYLIDNPNRRCPAIDKARARLGYDPRIYVKEGVRRYLTFLASERGLAA